MKRTGIVVILDRAEVVVENAAGVYLLVDHEGGDAGLPLAVYDGPVDGRGAAVLRQDGGVQVEGAKARHAPHFLRQHAEGHHDANGPNGVKAFAKLNFKNFSVPMSTSGNLDCTFALTGIRDMKGRVILRLKDGPVLAEKSLAEMTDGTVTTFSVFLKDLPAGIHTIQVDGVRNDGIVLGSCSRKFAYYPDKVVLKNTKSAAWQIRNILAGKRKLPFWRATTVGAKMEYMIPQDGVFSIYAVIRGEGKFRFTVSGNVREHVALDLWSPKYDRNPYVFGENFLGIYRLRSGDTISFTAEDAGAFLGEVFLRPANGEQLKIYMDKTPEGKFQSILVHGDGFSDFFFKEMTLQIMQDRIAELKRSGVIAYDWCIGTSATNYPSKIATMFGKQRDVKFSRKRDQLAAERMEKLNHTTGKDSLQIFREETRKHHMPYSITLRANAFYGSKIEMDKNAQYLVDHPEFFIVEPWGKRLKPSYAYREIRDFYLALAKEIATYKPDILTIEFLRHPPFFGYDRPLVEQYRRLYGSCDKRNYMDERWLNMIGQIMTDWIGEVRREIKKIHPDIELMINFDCEHYREQGIDITTILKRGLVDGISPGFYGIGSQKYFALKPFRDMIEQAPNKVKLYPRVEAVIKGHDPTPEEEAGLVKRPVQITVSNNLWKSVFYKFIQDGADGIRPFNGGSSGLARRLNDRAEVKRFATFTEPLLDIRYFGVEEK